MAISLVILIASTALIARAAAKIYRVGVLMYGKRPGARRAAALAALLTATEE